MKKIILAILTLAVTFASVRALASSEAKVTELLSVLDIMNGDENGNLNLEKKVTRAEFVKMSVAASEFRSTVATGLKISPYSDVPAAYWASPYIKAGIDNGFCKGYTDSTFRPDNFVSFEEALTILLRVLGYSDDDFGNSWPYGQLGLAENLDITEGSDAKPGEELTRKKAAILIYNTLNTNIKNSNGKLLTVFDTEIIEDTILISHGNTNKKEIHTSAGTFSIKKPLSEDISGLHGDLYVENGDTVIGFVPDDPSDKPEKHIVYSKLGNDIITYNNGDMKALSVPSNISIYEDEIKTSYSNKISEIQMGDVLYVHQGKDCDSEYIIYEEGNIDGPVTFKPGYTSPAPASARVIRDGELSSARSLIENDIIYYVSGLDMIFAYSNKVVGIYESAEPSRDAPAYITVSGTKYKIEGDSAFKKLSSAGSLKYGDTVTLLLGKTNDVADVLTHTQTADDVCGYIFETGSKEYQKNDLSKYTSMYVKAVLPNGQIREYQTDKNYKSYKNSVKSFSFENGKAKPESISKNTKISGTFDWKNKTLGSEALADSLKILDVSTTDSAKEANCVTVFPERLDGVKISSDKILYCGKNSAGKVESLILMDVTGDMYSYGIIKKAEKISMDLNLTGIYEFDIKGKLSNHTSSGVLYSVRKGQGAKIDRTASGSIQNMKEIAEINEKITVVSETILKTADKTYKISDDVSVYRRDSDNNYTIIPISEVINNDSCKLTAFYDKDMEAGGLVRIIVAN